MTKPIDRPEDAAAKRFAIISPLLVDGLDRGKYRELVAGIVEHEKISERTIRRYLAAYRDDGFDGLKPCGGWHREEDRLPGNFGEILGQAIILRREVPGRSVNDILKILRGENVDGADRVPRSTLQRHLQLAGFGAGRMRIYMKKGAAARRFQKEHRNQLWQSDIKYGPHTVVSKDGRKGQIYCVVWLDDATRFVVEAKFYARQTVDAIEDSFRGAITKFGVPEAIFVDNGKQFRSQWLSTACAKLGVRLLTSRPYHPEGKGKIEKFNQLLDKFIAEAVLKKPADINEYNELLDLWVSEYYAKHPHSGIGGASPEACFGIDTRPLKFVDAAVLRDAFMHRDKRKVNKVGCISWDGEQ